MFAGELAKPSSHCLGAFDTETDRLAGYLIVSRYVDAWHIMNLAVDEPYRRRGIARRLLEDLFEATAADGMRGYTLEVRVSNRSAIRLYEVLGFRISGRPARLLHGQPRGRLRHVEGPGGARATARTTRR